jgi:hypothetical protein
VSPSLGARPSGCARCAGSGPDPRPRTDRRRLRRWHIDVAALDWAGHESRPQSTAIRRGQSPRRASAGGFSQRRPGLPGAECPHPLEPHSALFFHARAAAWPLAARAQQGERMRHRRVSLQTKCELMINLNQTARPRHAVGRALARRRGERVAWEMNFGLAIMGGLVG